MNSRLLPLALIASLTLAACQVPGTEPEAPEEEASMKGDVNRTITEIAIDDADLATFVTAARAAGLMPTLSSPGPYTVFAPTESAFDALPDGAISNLLHPENQQMLEWIVSYHVAAGSVMSEDIAPGGLSTLNGSEISISASEGRVYIDNAEIVVADVLASNGVLHIIDAVLLPPEQDDAPMGMSDTEDTEETDDTEGVEVLMEKDKDSMKKEEMMEDKQGMMDKEDSMEDDHGMMEKEQPAVMEEREEPVVVEEKESEEPKVMGSTYAAYRPGVIGNGETSVLFFHASWCPSCQKNDSKLSSWYGQSVPTISTYKLDYDSAAELKARFGVVQQDTFVKIDGAGNVLDIVSFPTESVLKGLVEA